ncbi:MAG: hypothetical protein KIT84_14375 [Labilithrix sp.]|nr:hypothetical protein [Labilithrix sp.]MCW5812208.1 hypothetical protein [Labilithrix sp.]
MTEPLLVRIGLRTLRGFAEKGRPAAGADAIHLLNAEERKTLRRIERGAIVRAAIAGALSSLVAAVVELEIARPLLGARPRYATFGEQARFYAVVGAATVIASAIEIGFLYWDGLRSVHRLAHEAGLDLFPETEDDDRAIATAMARAALELPNPNASVFGVNPRREASRLRLLVASLVYKAKISVTNFMMKMLVRRMLGRAAVRSWLPFVAVPFTALWNAYICRRIMHEARIRAMGPSAAKELVGFALAMHEGTPSDEALACTVRAVASSIVRTEDLHPNLVALFRDLAGREARTDDDVDDTRTFLARLAALALADQTLVLRVLSIASVIDGRLTKNERRLLTEARTACGKDADLAAVEALRAAFVAGDPLPPSLVTALA